MGLLWCKSFALFRARREGVTLMNIQLKKYAYGIVYALPCIYLLIGYWWLRNPELSFVAYLIPLIVFGIIPVVDWFLGKDPVNPHEGEQVDELIGESFYYWLTRASVPIYLATIAGGAYVFVQQPMTLSQQAGWLFSMGTLGGILAINVGHELIHKTSRIDQWCGGILLSSVLYSGFKVEHVRGHHVWVSTPKDASSSRFGQSLYAFLPNAYVKNFINAWRLEAKRLASKGFSAVSWRNELIWWNVLSIAMAALITYWLGLGGLVFFLVQGAIAFTFLEIINYIEHYGLHRRKLENGRYERTDITHSWNSNYLLTNLLLFQLQRHSDHHAYPKRPYQVLRHHDESPQLPAGYATMVLVALLPPLWFRLMNPRVNQYYRQDD